MSGGFINQNQGTTKTKVRANCLICGDLILVEQGDMTLEEWMLCENEHKGEVWVHRNCLEKLRQREKERMSEG